MITKTITIEWECTNEAGDVEFTVHCDDRGVSIRKDDRCVTLDFVEFGTVIDMVKQYREATNA